MKKFQGLNERTCLNQKPIVKLGDKVEKGQVIADGAATHNGELALGRNVLVGFMSFDGYNFEDAIIISEELVKNDTYTSIHIEEFDVEIRETKLGREEFTRDIPNVSEKALRNLDESGIVGVGTYVRARRHSGRQGLAEVEDRIDAGRETAARDLRPRRRRCEKRFAGSPLGHRRDRVITQKVLAPYEPCPKTNARRSRRNSKMPRRKAMKVSPDVFEMIVRDGNGRGRTHHGRRRHAADSRSGSQVHCRAGATIPAGLTITGSKCAARTHRRAEESHPQAIVAGRRRAVDERDRKLNSMKRGDELRSGVLQMVKVYIATKRVISVGDKMAGRHGNKGVIAKILPVEDMPFWKTVRRCRSCSIRWAFPAV